LDLTLEHAKHDRARVSGVAVQSAGQVWLSIVGKAPHLPPLRMAQSENGAFGLGDYVVHSVVTVNRPKGRVGV
jgi:hypothetical protein